MESTMIEGMSNDMAGGLIVGGPLGIGVGVIAVISLIWYLFQAIANWKMFVIFYVLTFLMSFASNMQGTSGMGILFTIIGFVCLIAVLVILVMRDNKLSKAFGHDVGLTLGLIFFEPIFKLILGFGNSEYIGNPTE